MKLVHMTGPVVAALMVSACGAESKHASAPQRNAEEAAEEAAEQKRESQKEALEARKDADKARQEAQEATRAQREAEQNAQFAAQREAQADQQAREAQSPRAPRSGAAQLQAANADHDRGARSTVLFAANSAELSADAKIKLDELARTLRANPRNNVVVEGYSDDSGPASVNEQLSRRRADEVANYLESKGVPRDRIAAKALGTEHPVSREETDRGRAVNRRVEIVIQPVAK